MSEPSKNEFDKVLNEAAEDACTDCVKSPSRVNLKVRLRNPTFWMTFIPALVAFVYSVLSAIFDEIPAISKNEVINFVTAIITALTTLGVFVDPTSKGVCDCQHCMELDKPEE